MRDMRFVALVLAITLSLPASARSRPRWNDTYESRVEVLALMQTINANILGATSATRVLESWCVDHHMAGDPKIVAVRTPDAYKEPSADQLQRLGVLNASELRYRRVELRCGAHTFSIADNWYVPARLTAEMNTALDTTDTPFGKVVQPLNPYRRTINATLLWSPLSQGWELQSRSRVPSHRWRALAMPKELFQHRAVLYTAEHVPFSEVVETYQSELLGFPLRPTY